MLHIAFVSRRNPYLPLIAKALFESLDEHDTITECFGPGEKEERYFEAVRDVLATIGVSLRDTSLSDPDGIEPGWFDVVIDLDGGSNKETPRETSKYPVVIAWDVGQRENVAEKEELKKALASWATKLHEIVFCFVKHGYLEAISELRRKTDKLLDALPEGVIAHDANRRIFYFNKEAEAITGYKREEVIGKDCHDAFPGGFCGERCSFREGLIIPEFKELRYPVEFKRKNGGKCLLEMRVAPIKNDRGANIGVLASFRDIESEVRFGRYREAGSFCGIVGRDPKILHVFDLIRDVAQISLPVLIQGESGTGKELVARAIHRNSPRAKGPFIAVNCAAIPDSLIESELFGYVKGAFTGAIRDKRGRFELAHGGTIFLDEIGDISPMMQAKLLRILETGCFERLGSEKSIKVDVRVISATNKDLKKEIKEGRFREDLFYRISTIPITLPPLRERRSDIPLLVDHLLKRFSRKFGFESPKISDKALERLMSYHWPGNVRELENIIQYSLMRARGGLIQLEHLPAELPEKTEPQTRVEPTTACERRFRRRKLTVRDVEKALQKTGNNKLRAAQLLKVSRATLYRFLRDYGL